MGDSNQRGGEGEPEGEVKRKKEKMHTFGVLELKIV